MIYHWSYKSHQNKQIRKKIKTKQKQSKKENKQTKPLILEII